jgi:hypothetical protein
MHLAPRVICLPSRITYSTFTPVPITYRRAMFTNIRSTISGFLSESVDPSVNSKSFYDLKATLPGTKGEFDFVSDFPPSHSRDVSSRCEVVS